MKAPRFAAYAVGLAALATIAAWTRADACATEAQTGPEFPEELLHWEARPGAPIFGGTGMETWDKTIRERSWILKEGDVWRMWYDGYNTGRKPTHFMGLATSRDGLEWKRESGERPIFDGSWIEDVCVVKEGGVYQMFSEGLDDIAHRLSSPDGVHWKEEGNLQIRRVKGEPIAPGPYGTPSVWLQDGTWFLLYERDDRAVWLASSKTMEVWTNLQDDPVLNCGPERYDIAGIAVDQIMRYKGRYYAWYHGAPQKSWAEWCTCLAVSEDLVHWRKYPGNPVLPVDPKDPKRSSAFLVETEGAFRMYVTHPDVKVYFPKAGR